MLLFNNNLLVQAFQISLVLISSLKRFNLFLIYAESPMDEDESSGLSLKKSLSSFRFGTPTSLLKGNI